MDLLGKGAYAKVYRKGAVAVKITDSKRAANRELYALEKMKRSKHVIKLYDSYMYKKWFVLELELGQTTMADIQVNIRRKFIPKLFDFARNILRDLYLAECSHNDIKAANIVLTRNGDFKLIDFGVSSFGFSKPTWSIFTPGIKPFEGYTPYADIWSMGITIIAFILGKKTSTKFRDTLPTTKYGVDVESLDLGIPKKYIRILRQMTLFKPWLRYKVLGL